MLFPLTRPYVAVGILFSAASSLAQDFSIDRHRMVVDLPSAVALRMADVNGDGLPDLLRLADRSLTVLLQDAAGGFSATDTGLFPDEGTFFCDLAVGNLGSGGQLPDVAVLSDDGEVDILLNQGSGTLTWLQPSPIVRPGPQVEVSQVLVADLDGTGVEDVIVLLDGGPRLLFVFLDDGNGGFNDVTLTHVPDNALLSTTDPHATLADCDGDGDPDLIVASPATEPILVDNDLNGLGVMSLNAGAFPDTAPFAKRVLAADLVGDALPDVVFGLPGPGETTPELWLNSGTGFASVPTPSNFLVENVHELFAADADGDQIADLIALHEAGSVLVGKGDATGSFALATELLAPAPRTALCVGDLDNDGDLDLCSGGSKFEDQVLLGRSDGSFLDTEAVDFPLGTAASGHLGALADVDNNGDPDVVIYEQDGDPLWFRNDGSARFVEGAPGPVPALPPDTGYHMLTKASVVGPGRRGLILAANPGATRPLRIVVPAVGGFEEQTDLRFPGLGSIPDVVAMARGPVFTDGAPVSQLDDLVLVDSGGKLYLARNLNGVYSLVSGAFPVFPLDEPSRVLLGDIDTDGNCDVVVLDPGVPIRFFAGSPAGVFSEPFGTFPVGARNGLLEDVDEDGDLDLILVRPTTGLIVLSGDGAGNFTDETNSLLTQQPRGHITDLALLPANPHVAGSVHSLLLGTGNTADQLLKWNGSAFGPRIELPYRGSEQTTALLVGDVDREGDTDVVTLRRRTLPGLLRNADKHLSTTGVAQIGRSLGLRFVTPAPDSGVFLFLGPALPAIATPYGALRINAQSLLVQFIIVGDRELSTEWPMPPTLAPGQPPIQAAFVDPSLNITLSNLERVILTDH